MHADKNLTKISRDYKKFVREMSIMKNSMDRASDTYNARLEGKEERSLEIARKMKALGDSTEKIHTVTGISEEIIETM